MNCVEISQRKQIGMYFHITIVFLAAIIILFLSPAAWALEGSADSSASYDIYQVNGKSVIIYSGDAVSAGDDELINRKDENNVLSKTLNAGSNGPVNIEADSMDYDNIRDAYHAKGKVNINYGGASLFADDVELDNKNNVATAEGGALMKMGQDTLSGEKIVLNIENKTGAAYKANAFYSRNNFYVRGDKIEKTGDNTYYIKQPVATTCNGDKPDWEIAGSEMNVTIEGYGLMKDARFRAKGLPVLYSPYLPFPAKTIRQSGFLMPSVAYSRDKDGIDIEVPYFWAISPRTDATFYQRYIEKRGFKEGAEFRYYLGEKSFGTFYGDYIEDTRNVTDTADTATNRDWQEMHRRWSYYFNHQTNFNSQFYIRTDLMKVSDKWYFKDFSAHNYYLDNYADKTGDDFKKVSFRGDQSLRYTESKVRVFKGWSNYSLTGLVNSSEDFAAASNDQTLQRYPEVILTGAKQQFMGTPFYYEFTGTYDYLYREEGQKGHYIDFSPSISLPFNLSGYLKVTPQFSLKETFWSRDDNQTGSDKKTADRTVYNASLSISSQAARIFDVNFNNWEKVRHEIKPEIIYSYVPRVSGDNLPDYYLSAWSPFMLPVTTPVKTVFDNAFEEQNAAAWSLTNTLTARIKDGSGASSYLEFLRLKVFQTYDIHEANKGMEGIIVERRPLSDFGMEFDFTPHKYLSFMARNLYSVYDGWKQTNYDLHLKDGRGDSLLIGYRYTLDSLEEINFGLKAAITSNIDAAIIARRDLFNSRTIENSLGFIYHKQCWTMGLDLTETNDDVRFMFKISLAGFGNSLVNK